MKRHWSKGCGNQDRCGYFGGMKNLLLFLLLVLVANSLHAHSGKVPECVAALKNNGAIFKPVQLFTMFSATMDLEGRWKDTLRAADVLQLDLNTASRSGTDVGICLALEIPSSYGSIVLDLIRTQITSDDFKVNTSSGLDAGYIHIILTNIGPSFASNMVVE